MQQRKSKGLKVERAWVNGRNRTKVCRTDGIWYHRINMGAELAMYLGIDPSSMLRLSVREITPRKTKITNLLIACYACLID